MRNLIVNEYTVGGSLLLVGFGFFSTRFADILSYQVTTIPSAIPMIGGASVTVGRILGVVPATLGLAVLMGKFRKTPVLGELTKLPIVSEAYDIVEERLRQTAFLNKGLKVTLVDNRVKPKTEETFLYKNGLKDGLYMLFNENGQLLVSENYKENLLNGLFDYFHENGQLHVKGIYKNGNPIDGQLEYFFSNGSIKKRENYKDGKLNGPYESFYEDGTIEIKVNYKDGKLNGLWEGFHENGTIADKVNIKDGIREGLQTSYHENGSLASWEYLKNGEKSGISGSFWPNGEVSMISSWTNNENDNKKHGWQIFMEDYTPSEISNAFCYENGEMMIYREINMDICAGLNVNQQIEKFNEKSKLLFQN